ncbi:cytoplasm protein [Thecamonas trahens ATCC 50062]|uniref:Cytoplasm protein n=1 Tax=Thecamonas trahens ATCC 50062 TaxID=461836 RepID=A0A0L0D9C2_THETB|nr:cytoplasm protein [Thecamonas trahens ATCC 50062]KNC48646.1 cytoplasm protein [Thecamonas trahens ATCC 50062]|eukprot:XP_013762702.1 cytoplasm protein [Thecamonas trahens ATCC 50062]
MCGIAVIAAPRAGDAHPCLLSRVAARGPDSTTSAVLAPGLVLTASVLSLRAPFTAQPLHDEDSGVVMAFNGELYDGALLSYRDSEVCDSAALAAAVFDALSVANPPTPAAAAAALRHALAAAVDVGEWALVVWLPALSTLLWARDRFGRRSLLEARSGDGELAAVASVACLCEPDPSSPALDWSPVFPAGVYGASWDPDAGRLSEPVLAEFHPVPGLPAMELLDLLPPPAAAAAEPDCEPVVVAASDLLPAVESLGALLTEAVARRVVNVRDAASVGILFSGGLDSMVVAALAHAVLPPHTAIELINVAFAKDAAPEDAFNTPDRMTGTASAAHLVEHYAPDRTWIWVPVNVRAADLTAATPAIAETVAPAATAMDLSIGAALYFASSLERRADATAPLAPARVLLTGLGADELLGGYTRHRARWTRGGWSALSAELALDFARLWRRNLGRDDRVVAAHGCELRLPFLDEDVVAFLTSLPLAWRTDPSRERGVGDKHLLRALAAQLELGAAAAAPKRAIQFGSRIAKVLPKCDGTTALGALGL